MASDKVKVTTNLSNWRFFDQHVGNDVQGGLFVSAKTTLIAAGPPRISMNVESNNSLRNNTNLAYPIGIVENFGLNQNKSIQKLFEIGSQRSYHIPGRTIGSLSLGRIIFWGPSLLRVLYAYYPTGGNGLGKYGNKLDGVESEQGDISPILDAPGYGENGEISSTATPENSDFFINLASDLFDHPLGLLVYLRNNQDGSYAAFYIEDAYIQSHNFSINASSILIAESVTAQYDRIVPINIKSAKSGNTGSGLGLISGGFSQTSFA